MSLKSTALEMLRKNNREAKLDFYNRMTDSIVEYKNSKDAAFNNWLKLGSEVPLVGRQIGKQAYMKEKCKALIAMDREQLQAAHLFEMEKIINETLYNNQLQTAVIEKSVWFSGDPNTPAYH